MDDPVLTRSPGLIQARPEPTLGTTEVPDATRPSTTASLQVLAVSRGLRSLQDVLWGDTLVDKFTMAHWRELLKQGPTPPAGRPVDIQG